jgi:transketolase
MSNFTIKSLKATKEGFGEGVKIAGKDIKVIGLGADITASVGMNLFAETYPERFFSFGIAEQNCIGVAAGLALSGKIPVFSTYAVFSALRTTDQIRISICYNKLHVIIGGAHAGLSVGPDGATHQALEDMAIMRSLPNMTIISPCDATQAKLATIAAIEKNRGPVYIRYGREAVPDYTNEKQEFTIGKAQTIIEGNDLTIIASGHMLWEAILASDKLKERGIQARVINLHTIKPIDEGIIIKSAKETGLIITAEEHQIYGGMGSAVAEVVVKHFPVPMDFIGVRDTFGESGKAEELMKKYGLTADSIYKKAIENYSRKIKN